MGSRRLQDAVEPASELIGLVVFSGIAIDVEEEGSRAEIEWVELQGLLQMLFGQRALTAGGQGGAEAGFFGRRVRVVTDGERKRLCRFVVLPADEEHVAERRIHIAVLGKLLLHLGEHAITLHHPRRHSPLHAILNERDAEIAAGELGRRFAPGSYIAGWRVFRVVRTPLNAMVGEDGVTSILRFLLRHMTGDAVAGSGRVRGREARAGVALEAARAEPRDAVRGRDVRIVTGTAPHSISAGAFAETEGQLFGLADDTE